MAKSTDGREWAHLDELRPGDSLIPDGGFDCMHEGQAVVVALAEDGSLFVPCNFGQHNLAGQLDADGNSLVGFWRMAT